jgi:uncharacterized protein (DUF362 family)
MAKARVVIVRSRNIWIGAGGLDTAIVDRMLSRGLALLHGDGETATLFRGQDRVGIKINTIGGRALSTRPEVALGLAGQLARIGVPENNLIVWDRTTRELREAGYATAAKTKGVRVLGTDMEEIGYGQDLVSHLGVGSLFSKIQTDLTTASVSLAILKDHGLAGVTAGMKNYFGAIHNPNKYHDAHCDPHVAEVFDAPPVKAKHRLTVLDALVVQYHKGPSYHPRWAGKYGGFVLSLDPVAADTVGWTIIERLRAEAGLPTLLDEDRAPGYIATAGKMGLGVADPAAIEIIEETLA